MPDTDPPTLTPDDFPTEPKVEFLTQLEADQLNAAIANTAPTPGSGPAGQVESRRFEDVFPGQQAPMKIEGWDELIRLVRDLQSDVELIKNHMTGA